VLAFAAWNRGVQLIGASRAGPFLHLVPIYNRRAGRAVARRDTGRISRGRLALILTGVWLASHRKATV